MNHSESQLRAVLILLPTLPGYVASKLAARLPTGSLMQTTLRALPPIFEAAGELNLALFYLSGSYYTITKRLLGINYVSSRLKTPGFFPS